jgi:hypothetical protein
VGLVSCAIFLTSSAPNGATMEERRYASYFNDAGWTYDGEIPDGYASWSGEGETIVAVNCEPHDKPCFAINGQWLFVYFDNIVYWENPDSTIGVRYEVKKSGLY